MLVFEKAAVSQRCEARNVISVAALSLNVDVRTLLL